MTLAVAVSYSTVTFDSNRTVTTSTPGYDEDATQRGTRSRGGKPSKEGVDDAAEAKPWRGRGGVVLLRRRGEW